MGAWRATWRALPGLAWVELGRGQVEGRLHYPCAPAFTHTPPPCRQGRIEILLIHCRDKKMDGELGETWCRRCRTPTCPSPTTSAVLPSDAVAPTPPRQPSHLGPLPPAPSPGRLALGPPTHSGSALGLPSLATSTPTIPSLHRVG